MIYDLLLEARTYHRVLVEAGSERDVREHLWKIGADLDYKNRVPVNIYEAKGLVAYDSIDEIRDMFPVSPENIISYRIEDGRISEIVRK